MRIVIGCKDPLKRIKAFKLLENETDKGNVEAMRILGKASLKGIFTPRADIERAAHYFQMAIVKGDVESMRNYADILYEGADKVPMNKEEAVRLYKMAAEKGDELSICKVAELLEKGDGVPMNKKEAFRFYKIAADGEKGEIKFEAKRRVTKLEMELLLSNKYCFSLDFKKSDFLL